MIILGLWALFKKNYNYCKTIVFWPFYGRLDVVKCTNWQATVFTHCHAKITNLPKILMQWWFKEKCKDECQKLSCGKAVTMYHMSQGKKLSHVQHQCSFSLVILMLHVTYVVVLGNHSWRWRVWWRQSRLFCKCLSSVFSS